MQNKLKAYRAALGLTQQQMAEQIGIGIVSYNRKEQGLVEFNHSEMAKILSLIKAIVPDATIDSVFYSESINI